MKFEYHVKPTGSDAACGDVEHPFATISKAAQMASPGDTVIVHEGVYRERVDPKRGGLSEHERITYCGAEGEARPVIKGSECVQGWTELADHPHVWTVVLDNTMFGDFNPFATPIFGDWLEMPKFGKDPDKHLGDVYLNGVSFFESTTLEGVYDPQPRDTDEDFALKIPC
ncbi:MAG: right-handed parallel beta-helix repeat-containing protein, partial [Bifidobacterium sp.]|nr:right-handed parallel beta-helix repeat-containing protein [Bifidobacterium sp.]